VDGTLLLQDPTPLKAYTFMKAGIIKGMSVGFETLQSSMDGDTRILIPRIKAPIDLGGLLWQ
jgi:Escherichia/Staphylococcus phage prohead protease